MFKYKSELVPKNNVHNILFEWFDRWKTEDKYLIK